MNEKQIQRCMAYLELARTAIDNAELRIVGLAAVERQGPALVKACAEIAAGSSNLYLCIQEIEAFAREHVESPKDASTTHRSAP